MILKENFSTLNNIYDKSVDFQECHSKKDTLEYRKLLKTTIFKDIKNKVTISKIEKLDYSFFERLFFILKLFAEISEHEYLKKNIYIIDYEIENNIKEKEVLLSKEIIKIDKYFK